MFATNTRLPFLKSILSHAAEIFDITHEMAAARLKRIAAYLCIYQVWGGWKNPQINISKMLNIDL